MTLGNGSPRIMVVEDEGIIAQDIKNCLEGLGYIVPDVVFTGREAIQRAEELRPDLVLMDIVLKGDIDGIETATEIRRKYNIPIVYLTAYEDDRTLKRAKLTEPLGYILKPFEERYLRSSIEMALYKHQMETRLKENERWLSTILKSVGDAVIVTDNEGLIRYMNPVAESLIGWKLHEIAGKNISEILKLIDENSKQPVQNPIEKSLSENINVARSNHTVLIAKNGKEIAIDHSSSPLRDDKGRLTGAVLIIQDITQRKFSENALRDSENKFRNLFDFATDAIFVQSLNGKILSVNNQACILLGYRKEEFEKLRFSDLINESIIDSTFAIYASLKEKGNYQFETQYRRKDGTFVDVEISMRLISLLDEEVVQLFVRDITERKLAQEKINMLAHAIKGISECVSITDLSGKITFVNDAFEKTYGYTREELIGKNINVVRTADNPLEGTEIEISAQKGGWQGEIINRAKNGREFPTYLSTTLLKNDKGEPVAFIGIASDITERKKSEQAIKESEKRFQDLYDSAPDMYFSILPNGIIKSVNKFGAEYLKYGSHELIGQEIWKIVYPHDVADVKQSIAKIFANKETKSKLEFREIRKDGSIIWVNVSTRLILEASGQPRELFIICRDITINKEFQIAVLESEKKYRNLAQNAPVSVARYSMKNLAFEYANDEFEKQMGCSVEEYGKLPKEEKQNIIYKEDREKLAENYNNWKKNGYKGILHFDYRIINRKNQLLWLDTFVYADFDDTTGKALVMNEICIDITERKRAELATIESEKKYKNLATNAPIAVTRISADTLKYEYVNDEFVRQTGYTMEEYNALGREELKAMAYPEDREKVTEFFSRWKEEGFRGTKHIDYRTYNRSGELVWVDTFLFADFDEEDNVLAINQICIDITQQRTAQQKVLESENKYKNLAANAPVAVTRILLRTKTYDFVNEEFVRQSGYTLEEFNSLTDDKLIDMIHPDDRQKVFKFYAEWEAVNYSGTQHIDYKIINRHGKTVWLDTYLYAENGEDGKAEAINQICIDITEQKKAEEDLRERDKRFKALIENISDLISLVDDKGNIIYASPSIVNILGYQPEEYVSKNIYEFIDKDDVPVMEHLFEQILSKPDNMVSNVQFRLKHKDGNYYWSEATAHNLMQDSSIGAIVFNYRDITERKKAEAEILLQKSYFQQLFENSPEAIVILDNQDKIVDLNKGFERMFQFSADEIRGSVLSSLIVPESLAEQASQITLFVLKGEVMHRETVRKRKDGSTVEVSLLAYPITLGENQIGVYGIYSDITERKETEKALKNSEERYKAFVKQSTEGIWRYEFLEPIPVKLSVNEQIKIIFKYGYLAECNDVFARMYGYDSANDIVGSRIGDLMDQNDPKNIEYLKQSILKGYKIDNIESYEKDKEGNQRIFVNNLVGIVENDYLVRVWGSQRDITEAKKAQEELSKTQFRLATLLNNLQDVVLYETGGGVEFISENVVDMLGYPSGKFQTREFFRTITHPGDWKVIEEKTKEWHRNGAEGVLNLMFRVRRSDGRYIWVEDHMIKIKNNGTSHMAGVLIDVTDHKNAEEKLKQLADKLTQSNKELEQFAYVASHDLQEPLRMVASYIQLLQRRYKGKLSAEADEFINYSVDGVVRMKTLINDLLAYSRVNTKEAPLEPVDLNKVVATTLSNLKASIEENKATVNVENLPTVSANTLHMNQLFQNLLSNAIKFKKPDVDPVVNITAKHLGNEWHFTVSDNGIGIDKEFSDKIFIIFQRLHNQTEYRGTGIGLAICKKIIEKLGGHIWVESEVGKGCTFNFTIPDREQQEKEPMAE